MISHETSVGKGKKHQVVFSGEEQIEVVVNAQDGFHLYVEEMRMVDAHTINCWQDKLGFHSSLEEVRMIDTRCS